MATADLDPNGDNGTNNWNRTPSSGSHFSAIDDAVRQPTAPGTSDFLSSANPGGAIEDFNMTTTGTDVTVTRVVVWWYGKDGNGNGNEVDVDINLTGSFEGAQTLGILGDDVLKWYNKTFNGSWSQAQLNALILRMDVAGAGAGGAAICHEYYCRITFTEAPVGFTRKIKISGTFQDKPIKTKVAGTFQDKITKIKVGGTFQDA